MHCDADVTECQTELDRLRVHLFLAGLDPEFDQVTGTHLEHKCTHYGGSKHTRAGCYELIGCPDWWDHSKAPRKNRSKSPNTSSDSDLVSPAVSTTPAPASASVAITGTQGYVLHSSSKKHARIIDTRATDHMTFDPGQIASHTPSPQSMVSNANAVHEENQESTTPQILNFFPKMSLCFKTTGCQWKAIGRPP
ncbi:hypothetical protein L3X38_004910 [Prunus dulcis]|uniref:Uncharacterized protein n=1 Tax=Prunus dulcis TaxID=3755 RepID=A0AAD4ZPW7_PRUDU|nr:hypothetical protein L3X38_004910 [Prunus dulcis]